MSLIVHVLWGYLVSWLFGFSYTALRLSVALLGLVGVWGLYALLLEQVPPKTIAGGFEFNDLYDPSYKDRRPELVVGAS
ncbi:MAG: hypothetical protein GX806_00410 [Lentisphaerae bacterium]|nr:hypothetical protein [Lentisphaerota bacterium]